MKVSLPALILLLTLLCQPRISFSSSHKDADQEEGSVTMGEVQEDISDTMESISRYSAKQREEATAVAREELAEMGRKIDSLQEKISGQWDQFSDAARDQWRDTLAALQEKRVASAEWYGRVRHSSEDAWDEIKEGYVEAITELEQAWEKARDKFSAENTGDDESI